MVDQTSPTATPTPELAVVVVTFNSAETIVPCLRSLEAGGAEAEVVVLDNASTDQTVAELRRELPDVQLIRNPTNVGFGRGCNIAWQATSAPFVLVLNPDTELRPGATRALLDFALTHPRAALVGPRIVNGDGSLQHSCFKFPTLRMVLTGFFGLTELDSPANGRYRPVEYECAHQVEHLLGACLLIRRSAAEQVGLFDERFYMYFEETDLCYRTRQAGWENWYTPSTTVSHIGAHSTSRDPERMSAEFHRSQAHFYRKHYAWWRLVALKLMSAVGVAYWSLRTLRGLLRGRVDRLVARRRFGSYWTILRV